MTLIIATLTADAVWLSADRLVADSAPGFTMPTATDDAYPGGGGPTTVTVLGELRKVLNNGAIAATGAGRVPSVSAWLRAVLKCDDLDAALACTPDPGDVAILAGLSAGRPVAFVWSAGERVSLPIGAHVMAPGPDPESAGYVAIVDAWEPAGRGVCVERFHDMIAANVFDAYTRGRMVPGIGTSRAIDTVRIGAPA